MSEWVKVFAAKPGNSALIPGTHMQKERTTHAHPPK